MYDLAPSLEHPTARLHLEQLIRPGIDPALFVGDILSLSRMSAAFAASCPPPWPAPGLQLTPEIHYRSEQWFPLDRIRTIFQRFYRTAFRFLPIQTSTPFAAAASWASVVAEFPPFLTGITTPAALLERLLTDSELRTRFLFWSFMPIRFYGNSFDRYPGQADVIGTWLGERKRDAERLSCLDAACGDGAASYGLARLFLHRGWQPGTFAIEGWTLDPLEVWSAAHAAFPHDLRREKDFRSWVAPVFAANAHASIRFRTTDLLNSSRASENGAGFNLILCNGLLGGPIINRPEELGCVVRSLASLLRPGGLLLAADHFHGGWKRTIPEGRLGDLFMSCGLVVEKAGEGLAGVKGQ